MVDASPPSAASATAWSEAERLDLCGKYIEIFALRNRTDEGAVDAQKELFSTTPSALATCR